MQILLSPNSFMFILFLWLDQPHANYKSYCPLSYSLYTQVYKHYYRMANTVISDSSYSEIPRTNPAIRQDTLIAHWKHT